MLNLDTLDAGDLNILCLAGDINPFDPTTDPIPTKDGRIEQTTGIPLSSAEPGQPHRVLRVLLQGADRLVYLGGWALYPNVMVTVLKRAPFAGPLLVEVAGEHHALAYDLAEVLIVTE